MVVSRYGCSGYECVLHELIIVILNECDEIMCQLCIIEGESDMNYAQEEIINENEKEDEN
jgi:hypothetical protein